MAVHGVHGVIDLLPAGVHLLRAIVSQSYMHFVEVHGVPLCIPRRETSSCGCKGACEARSVASSWLPRHFRVAKVINVSRRVAIAPLATSVFE